MGIKIGIIRFFEIEIKQHGHEFWLEYAPGGHRALTAGGVGMAQAATIIDKELEAPGASQLPPAASDPAYVAANSYGHSLDFDEPEVVDGMAYVFTLPPRQIIELTHNAGPEPLHHTTDLEFLGTIAEPTRFYPEHDTPLVLPSRRLTNPKHGWLAIDRNEVRKSSVGRQLKSQKADRMAVPFGFNIIDRVLGASSWVFPHGSSRNPGGMPLRWHGGPHPPTNTLIGVAL